jgi:hypothetical protein
MDEHTQVNPLPVESHSKISTNKEMEVRIEYCCHMLTEGRRKSEIKRFFKNNYGIGFRQVERYLRQARDRMIEESGKGKGELVSEAYGFYMSIIQSTDATITEKLAARRQADDLLGLAAPKRSIEAHVNADDMLDLWVDQLTPDQLRAIDTAAKVGEVVEEKHSESLRQQQAVSLRSAVAVVQEENAVALDSDLPKEEEEGSEGEVTKESIS